MPWCVLPLVQLLWDSELPGLPRNLPSLPDWGSSPSLFVQISFQFFALSLLLLAPLWFGYWNSWSCPRGSSVSSYFLNSNFFILFQLDVYFFHLFQIVDLSPSFLPFTVGSLYILLYFTLYRLHFFLYFATKLNHFREHLITSVLNSASGRLSVSSLLSSFSGVFICSFVWAIFLCLRIPVTNLRYYPGQGNPLCFIMVLSLGRGSKGTMPLVWLSPHSPSLPSLPTSGLCPFRCWFPGRWVCVCSRTPCASPTDSPVILGVSSTTATPTDFYSQRFWVFSFLCLRPGLLGLSCSPDVPPGSFVCECGTTISASPHLTCMVHHLALHPFHLGCPSLPFLPSGWMFL